MGNQTSKESDLLQQVVSASLRRSSCSAVDKTSDKHLVCKTMVGVAKAGVKDLIEKGVEKVVKNVLLQDLPKHSPDTVSQLIGAIKKFPLPDSAKQEIQDDSVVMRQTPEDSSSKIEVENENLLNTENNVCKEAALKQNERLKKDAQASEAFSENTVKSPISNIVTEKTLPKKKTKPISKQSRSLQYDPLPLPELLEDYDQERQKDFIKKLYDKFQGSFLQCKEEDFCYWFGSTVDIGDNKKLPKRIEWKLNYLSLQYFIRQLYAVKRKRLPRGFWKKVANIFKIDSKTIDERKFGKNTNNGSRETQTKINNLLNEIKKEIEQASSDMNE